ncbi:hypothetical protein OPV22_007264 [Ensete ventricosum]|uniref:Uncharacterized protein n=1 Tax=Ensete ventricosum TaxID=4639 RepID=A0AAV8RRF1_ENSVE|nr:hypothetical protein OPV22_007264 [Ensete ventricosum]
MASPPPFSVEDQTDEGFVDTFVTDMQPLRYYHHLQQQSQSTYDPQAQAHETYYTYHYDYDHSSAAAAAAAYHHHRYYCHYDPHDYSSATAYLPPSQPPHEQPAGPSSSGYHVAPELNPAAAAAVTAFSQLTQFAGTMEAAERAMAGKQDRRWHPKGGPQLSMTLALGTTSRAATTGKYACVPGHLCTKQKRPTSPSCFYDYLTDGTCNTPSYFGALLQVADGGTSSYKGGSRRGCELFIGGAVRGNSSYDNSVRSFRSRRRGRVVAEPGIASGPTPLKVIMPNKVKQLKIQLWSIKLSRARNNPKINVPHLGLRRPPVWAPQSGVQRRE